LAGSESHADSKPITPAKAALIRRTVAKWPQRAGRDEKSRVTSSS
jgi:hypothetical protein